jgi:hypothetical protein
MHKFTDIGQLRAVVKSICSSHDYKGPDEDGDPTYLHTDPYPVVTFEGTVKLHGTNAAIVKYTDGSIKFQGRNREITIEKDNAGFVADMQAKPHAKLFDKMPEFEDFCAIYGEWCGGNIQKGVAINGLPRMFVAFAVRIDGTYQYPNTLELVPSATQNDEFAGIYTTRDFPTFSLDIDFNCPEKAQEDLIRITEEVEAECPVGKHFDVSGIGEGVVWQGWYKDERYIFKVKGEKHSVTKVKKLAEVDVEAIANMREFVEYAVTENRLNQGLQVMKEAGHELDRKSTGHYLRWVVTDILKEEADTLAENGIDTTKIGKYISEKARVFWFNTVDGDL